MNKKRGLDYLRVDLATMRELGTNEAILLALIEAIASGHRKRDKDGFVGVETAYLAAQTGLNDRTIVRLRERLVAARKIVFKPGLNQNRQGRYRLVGMAGIRSDIMSGRERKNRSG